MLLVYLENEIPCFRPTDDQVARFERQLPEQADRPVVACRSEGEFLARLPEATAVFVWTFRQEWFALAPRLRHLCTPAAGRDYFKVVPPPEVTLHYGSFHGGIMGETALACVLGWCHGILPFADAMKDGPGWPRVEMARRGRRLFGATVLVLGFGAIGRAFARMAAPFGPRIIGVTRTPHPELCAEFPGATLATVDELDALLPQADHVVCFLPSGPETDNLLDRRRLALLRPGAVLYNFGRGNVVDEAALAEALSSGRLGGAVLDVFKAEPLPADSPLRRAPNCWLYPHASAFAPDYLDLYFAKCAQAMCVAAESPSTLN